MFACSFLGLCMSVQMEIASRVGTQLCFRALQHRPVSGKARALPGVAATALWSGGFITPQRKHQGN